jgi:hypothetical protein
MATNRRCELLDRLKREAVDAILSARKIRWARDVSVFEDSEICEQQRRKIDAFISHLLAGHEGQPCPCGDRPIIDAHITQAAKPRQELLRAFPFPSQSKAKAS